MGEINNSGEAFWDYHDGLGPLREAKFLRAQIAAEDAALIYSAYRGETVPEQSALLEDLYEKTCGHPIKGQRVIARSKFIYPITNDQAKKAKKNNYLADTCYIVRGPRSGNKLIENEYILDGVKLPRIYDTFKAAFKLRPAKPSSDPTISHYYIAFHDIIEMDFMEHFSINTDVLPRKFEEMSREAYLYFETAGFSESDPGQQKRTAENMQRSMTRKLMPLIEAKTNLMLSSPVYYAERSTIPKAPEIEDYNRHESAVECDLLVGRALGIAIKRDHTGEPYPYRPFLVMRSDKDHMNYAVPTNQPIDIFNA